MGKMIIVGSVGLALFMAALVGYVYRTDITATLDSLSLIPRPEHFTELYFVDPQSLPKKVAASDTVSFTFAVHNFEEQDIVYQYRVYVSEAKGITPVSTGTLFVAQNGTETLEETYRFKTSPPAGKIVVELLAQDQHIDFLFSSQ